MPCSFRRGVAAEVVVEVRVPAVDDRVTRRQVGEELLDLGLGRVAGWDHDPDCPRRCQLGHELLDGEGCLGALGRDLAGLVRGPVVGNDLVAVAEEAANHVRAHPAESDEADAHVGGSPSVVRFREFGGGLAGAGCGSRRPGSPRLVV
ncbi:MAG: hypothetical protein KatS3mg065_0086 [Chloroflexota bacterium]|nr:MAG: hypothetical protein KatS3mg065_0086 [Chloroflexota bacterium]